MSFEELPNLLRFYLACVEEEDNRSLRLKTSSLHRTLISPWDDREVLFHPEASVVPFAVEDRSDRNLLGRGAARVGQAERFYYGYPLLLDEKGYLVPLFVLEVEVEAAREGGFVLRPRDVLDLRVNHHLFRKVHAGLEELEAIQSDLEGEFGTFSDRLTTAFEHLGIDPPALDPCCLDPYPNAQTPRESWINRPILFRSERSVFTAHLRRELQALVKYDSLQAQVPETALAAFLEPKDLGGEADERESITEVLPLDRWQEKAARSALTRPLTVVTGPPGTGKSQVVVDLLASCAVSGKGVLFASKNNKAVDVVCERLREILGEEQDWILRLGSGQRMAECRDSMTVRLGNAAGDGSVPPLPDPRMLFDLDEAIARAQSEIEETDRKRQLFQRADRHRRFVESLVPDRWMEATPPGQQIHISKSALAKAGKHAYALAGVGRNPWWLGLLRVLWPGLLSRWVLEELDWVVSGLPDEMAEEVLSTLQPDAGKGYSALIKAIGNLERYAEWFAAKEEFETAYSDLLETEEAGRLAERIKEAKDDKAALSRDLLCARWTRRVKDEALLIRTQLGRYFDLSDRIRRTRGGSWLEVLHDFTRSIRTLTESLPVWIVTNLSARRSLPLQPALFDLLIIDEASQCDIPSSLPLLFRAKRVLVIGDPRQLRHISTLPADSEMRLAQEHGVADRMGRWSYNRRSFYQLAEEVIVKSGEDPVFLAEHYRSHPEVIEFSNRTFYGGRLVLRTDIPRLTEKLLPEAPGLFWHNRPGKVPQTGRSAFNMEEVTGAMELLGSWHDSGLLGREGLTFGIVTPFRAQMEQIEKAVLASPWWDEVDGRMTIGTAHRFQGDECDVMIFSPVVAPGMRERLVHWVARTDQLLNVAITRARAALHVVGDLEGCCAAGGYLGQFADFVSQHAGASANRRAVDSPAEMKMVQLLDGLGLWHQPGYSFERYRFDFLVVSPLGVRYDLEVDGRGHLTADQDRADRARDDAIERAGYEVTRVDARLLFEHEDHVRALLSRLG